MNEIGAAPAHPRPPLVGWRLGALSVIGFWAFYYLINTVHSAIAHSPDQLDMMERRAVVTSAGILLTFLLLLLLRRIEGRSMRFIVVAAFLGAIPASSVYGLINFTAFYVVHPSQWDLRELAQAHEHGAGTAAIVGEYVIDWYFFLVAWAMLYLALSYAGRVREAERNAARYRAEAQTAQLRALRYQINPHFIFNTLNSLSTLVLRGRTEEAERMIINLATFFRSSLAGDPTEDIALIDEIRMQRLYLDIEQSRFPDRLRVAVDVPEELEGIAVPGLILQPLVENAIKHGVARSSHAVTVTIHAARSEESLVLVVEDDGEQMAGPTPGLGLGLRNVRDRLSARFDGAASCVFAPRPEGGFRVEMRLPLAYGATP